MAKEGGRPMIRLCDPPKKIRSKDIFSLYPQGMGLYCDYADGGDALLILAEEKVPKGMDFYTWRCQRHKGKFAFLDDKMKKLIEPFPKTDMATQPQYVMTKEEFYGREMMAVLKEERNNYRKYYKDACVNMKILYKEDAAFDCISLYGTTILDEDKEKYEKKIGFSLKAMPYGDYMRAFHDKKDGKKPKEKQPAVLSEIQEWLSGTSFQEFESEITKRVIGQKAVSTVLAGIYYYLRGLVDSRPSKCNTIIVAPSGTGKTETYRAVRDYFKKHIPSLPIAQFDLSLITAEGIRGRGLSEMMDSFLQKHETNGRGILFMDEFDKKLVPCTTSRYENVNMQIQSELLTTIEGCEFTGEVGRESRTINTENTLFIALGSFDAIRRKRGEDAAGRISGFGQIARKGEVLHYDPITKEDMIELGGSYELLGRFPLVVNFERLEKDAIDRIIDKNLKEVRESLQIKVAATPEFRKRLHDSANTSYGCRKLNSMIMEAVMPVYAEALKVGGGKDCRIVIDGEGCGVLEGGEETYIREEDWQ